MIGFAWDRISSAYSSIDRYSLTSFLDILNGSLDSSSILTEGNSLIDALVKYFGFEVVDNSSKSSTPIIGNAQDLLHGALSYAKVYSVLLNAFNSLGECVAIALFMVIDLFPHASIVVCYKPSLNNEGLTYDIGSIYITLDGKSFRLINKNGSIASTSLSYSEIESSDILLNGFGFVTVYHYESYMSTAIDNLLSATCGGSNTNVPSEDSGKVKKD